MGQSAEHCIVVKSCCRIPSLIMPKFATKNDTPEPSSRDSQAAAGPAADPRTSVLLGGQGAASTIQRSQIPMILKTVVFRNPSWDGPTGVDPSVTRSISRGRVP